ncbi:hypothetical protein GGI25_003159 [Coemansia spiralis]|uniref:Uncharacterized protein n=1 Tax=Coemansia spiralis TaxID=417178 RepID=A0A9W8KYP7_9FUNG|nr:hypothetical protein GGI25_003159 [Coemansia spiralis]
MSQFTAETKDVFRDPPAGLLSIGDDDHCTEFVEGTRPILNYRALNSKTVRANCYQGSQPSSSALPGSKSPYIDLCSSEWTSYNAFRGYGSARLFLQITVFREFSVLEGSLYSIHFHWLRFERIFCGKEGVSHRNNCIKFIFLAYGKASPQGAVDIEFSETAFYILNPRLNKNGCVWLVRWVQWFKDLQDLDSSGD